MNAIVEQYKKTAIEHANRLFAYASADPKEQIEALEEIIQNAKDNIEVLKVI